MPALRGDARRIAGIAPYRTPFALQLLDPRALIVGVDRVTMHAHPVDVLHGGEPGGMADGKHLDLVAALDQRLRQTLEQRLLPADAGRIQFREDRYPHQRADLSNPYRRARSLLKSGSSHKSAIASSMVRRGNQPKLSRMA